MLPATPQVLQYSNVETFITFRSSTPLVLSLCDYFLLGRAWPNLRSWICLLFLVLGSAGYVLVDRGFEVKAYVWLVLWYAFFVFDTVSGFGCEVQASEGRLILNDPYDMAALLGTWETLSKASPPMQCSEAA